MREKTAFDRDFEKWMKKPSFAAAYARERAAIDEIDALVNQLDQARIDLGMTKGELARRAQKLPAYVRRLLVAKSKNPTLRSMMELARHLGLRLALVPQESGQRTMRALSARSSPSGHRATGRGTRERKRSPRTRTRS